MQFQGGLPKEYSTYLETKHREYDHSSKHGSKAVSERNEDGVPLAVVMYMVVARHCYQSSETNTNRKEAL